MYYGFVRLAVAVPQLSVADCRYNVQEIIKLAEEAERQKAQVVCFPELCITGYTCGDLFFQQYLYDRAMEALFVLQKYTERCSAAIIAGAPLRVGNRLFNTAIVLQGGRILGVVPKTNMPNNNEFYEKRWFASARDAADVEEIAVNGERVPFGTNLLFADSAFSFAIEICEDIWMPIPPSAQHVMHGADVIFNLSASSEHAAKSAYRHQMVAVHSRRCMAGYLYVSCGVSESTSSIVCGGDAFIAENGHILQESERFSQESQILVNEIDVELLRTERNKNTNFAADKLPRRYRTIALSEALYKEFALNRTIESHPFVPRSSEMLARNCFDVFSIQTAGLAKRWKHTGAASVIIGVSGGMDSSLALLVCAKTADLLHYDRKRVIALTMPGFGTTQRTRSNAETLAQCLGVTFREISIADACLQHFADINQDPALRDSVYENAQARERTQVLMDIANKENGLVVGTGDMSELALGWTTYNGDQTSMYGVNTGVPKTLMPHLLEWIGHQMNSEPLLEVLRDITATPVSPELLPAAPSGAIVQKTESIIGPYELHDFFLFYLVRFGCSPAKIAFLARQAFAERYSGAEIDKWLAFFLRRFFTQQFKRANLPDGPKTGTVSIARDMQIPSDAAAFVL